MGVKGLLKYIRNCPTGVRPEPLVLSTETKRKSRDPTAAKAILVCDFIAIVFWLLDIVHDAKKSSERYIALYGADFKEYTSRLIRFVEMLRHIDIEPVFFWDGPRGSGKEYEMKLSTWEKRARDSLEVILLHSRITKYDPTAELRFGKRIMQPLLVTELVMALQEAKVELITCKGEANNLMAEYMRVHGNACGILTNDTDMMLMHGVTAIHYKLFDQEDALKLSDDHIPANYKIAEVHCGTISPGYLAKCLKINENCLPALSILCGNDFTKDLNEEMDIKNSVLRYINYDYVNTYEYIKTVLEWIKDNEDACMRSTSFLAIHKIADVCKKEPRYTRAVRHSYAFYTRSHPAVVAAVMPAFSNSISSDSDDESEDSAEEENDDTTAIPFHINDNTNESGPVTAHSTRPGPKGVTMSSHLMITLTHARWLLSLLGIHQELPLPSSVFQPYVYIPLHGTAFKLKQKEKFYGDDAPAKEYYELLSKDRVFQDFKRCICSGSAIDNIGAVCVQYAHTKDAIKELLDKKAPSRKTSKSRKK
uniref:Asteroid domain-containing protein n=1 Tax=Amphimedon queenslandica TaxID=400682 RepID=A0A1X7UCL7_AMPQE